MALTVGLLLLKKHGQELGVQSPKVTPLIRPEMGRSDGPCILVKLNEGDALEMASGGQQRESGHKSTFLLPSPPRVF